MSIKMIKLEVPNEEGGVPWTEIRISDATAEEVAAARVGRCLGAGGSRFQSANMHGIHSIAVLTLEEFKARYPLAPEPTTSIAKAPTRPMRAATSCPPPANDKL